MIARHRIALSAAASLVATVQPGTRLEDMKGKALNVATPDGLTISAQEWGNPPAPASYSSTASRKAICRG